MFPEIQLRVIEDQIGGTASKPWILDTQTFDPTPIFDPFGLRRAVIPILRIRRDGSLEGLGTGFVLDPWNRILTAQHVVERAKDDDRLGIVTLNSYGVVFGTVRIPESAFCRIAWTYSFEIKQDDPMATLQGRTKSVSFDLAYGSLIDNQGSAPIANLPIRAHIYGRVNIGDHVVALGFPHILNVEDNGSTLLENDDIYAARGVVVATHSIGRGSSRPTPVIEVECNWPSGMSGGPVFNQRGEVVGVVSSSIDAENGRVAGRGWATWLETFPGVEFLLPSIDGLNPKHRICWGGFDGNELVDVRDLSIPSDQLASSHRSLQWRKISWCLGTDEWVSV